VGACAGQSLLAAAHPQPLAAFVQPVGGCLYCGAQGKSVPSAAPPRGQGDTQGRPAHAHGHGHCTTTHFLTHSLFHLLFQSSLSLTHSLNLSLKEYRRMRMAMDIVRPCTSLRHALTLLNRSLSHSLTHSSQSLILSLTHYPLTTLTEGGAAHAAWPWILYDPCTHSVTHSLSQSLTLSLTHSLSLNRSLSHSLTTRSLPSLKEERRMRMAMDIGTAHALPHSLSHSFPPSLARALTPHVPGYVCT